MSFMHRIGGVTAVFVAVAAVAVAMAPGTLDQRKCEVARASIERLGRAGAETLIANAAHAQALTDILLDASESQAVLTVKTTGQPVCKTFTVEDGRKIVLDVEDAVNLQSGHIFASASAALVQQVRTSLFAVEPQYVSRVVVDLAAPAHFTVERGEGQIRLVVTGAKAAPQAAPVATPVAVAAVKPGRHDATKASLEAVRRDVQQSKMHSEWMHNGISRMAATTYSAAKTAGMVLASARDGYMVLASRQSLPLPAEAPAPAPVAKRVERLAHDLEMVKASEVELHLPAIARLAQVAADNAAANPIAAAQAAAQAAAAQAEAKAAEASEAIRAVTEADSAEKPAAPSDTPAQEPESEKAGDANGPPPPPKRGEAERQASGGGAAVVGRMKQLISGIAGMPPNPAEAGIKTVDAQPVAVAKTEAPAEKTVEEPVIQGDPMDQIVSIDFRDMDITNVVSLLAQKAQINVIAGTELKGVVQANIKNITLRKAIDTVLRMHNLGIIQEEGIYRIVSYEDAVAAKRKTSMLKLENAKCEDILKTLSDVLKGSPDDNLITMSSDKQTNTLILAGPEGRIAELQALAQNLDVAKPVAPTVTETFKVNNSEPADLMKLVQSMQSKDIGKAAVDTRSGTLVITDVPVVLEQIRELLQKVDTPAKQVNIETMIVDAVLSDNAQTGIDWIYKAIAHYDSDGNADGTVRALGMESDVSGSAITPGSITSIPMAGQLTFSLLTSHSDIQGAIAGEVKANNAKLLANPVVVSVENKKANINISREIPYTQYTQSTTGPPVASTGFKEVGIILTVTPRVSHDEHIITDVDIKQSSSTETVNDIPVEDKRQTQTTLRTKNGQTIFIGGLRQVDDTSSITKTPVLGDIPIVNLLFRNNSIKKQRTDLLVFLTCTILPDELEPLSPEHQKAYGELGTVSMIPNSQHTLIHNTVNPGEFRDPAWKYRRPAEDGPLIPKSEEKPKQKTKRPQKPTRID